METYLKKGKTSTMTRSDLDIWQLLPYVRESRKLLLITIIKLCSLLSPEKITCSWQDNLSWLDQTDGNYQRELRFTVWDIQGHSIIPQLFPCLWQLYCIDDLNQFTANRFDHFKSVASSCIIERNSTLITFISL